MISEEQLKELLKILNGGVKLDYPRTIDFKKDIPITTLRKITYCDLSGCELELTRYQFEKPPKDSFGWRCDYTFKKPLYIKTWRIIE